MSYKLIQYQFCDVKSNNIFHWVSHMIIVHCICKRSEVMPSNKTFCSLPHGVRIEFMCTVVGISKLKRVHDGIIIYFIVINLAFCGKTSMKFRFCWANFSHSNVRRKKPIDSSMKTLQPIIIAKWCDEVSDLEYQQNYYLDLGVSEIYALAKLKNNH